MDATTLDIVWRYSVACKPSPIVSHILMCLTYMTPSNIDFSGCVLKGAMKHDKGISGFGHFGGVDRADELMILKGVLAYGQKVSKRTLSAVTLYSETTIAKHKRIMMAEGLIDEKWSICNQVLEDKIKAASRVSAGLHNSFGSKGVDGLNKFVG